MPWITSRGFLDASTYIGNPFPLIDWFVFGAATAAAVVPRLAKVAVIIGGVSIMLTLVALSVDLAEGLSSSPEHGLVLAALASALAVGDVTMDIATAVPPN